MSIRVGILISLSVGRKKVHKYSNTAVKSKNQFNVDKFSNFWLNMTTFVFTNMFATWCGRGLFIMLHSNGLF